MMSSKSGLNKHTQSMPVDKFYDDHPHKISTRIIDGKKWMEKTVDEQRVMYKEFYVQEQLSKKGLSPLCKNLCKSSFLEEFINGNTLDKYEKIPDEILTLLAKKLMLVHEESKKLTDHEHFSDSVFLPKRTYDPKPVLSGVLKNVDQDQIPGIDKELLELATTAVEQLVRNTKHSLTIIHGDLSPSNVIEKKDNDLMLIDWTDCRLDVGINDITQAIHLFDLSEDQAKILTDAYQHELNEPIFVSYQLFLCSLYDIIKAMKTQNAELPIDKFLKQQNHLRVCTNK
jgi:hypothetical protein